MYVEKKKVKKIGNEVYPPIMRKFLDEAREYINTHKPSEVPKRVKDLVAKYEDWRTKECINMIASENILSPTAKALFATDFASRTAQAFIGARMYKGYDLLDPIEALVMEQAKKLYNANFVDHRPTSGATANAVAFGAFTKVGDTIMSETVPAGAHISYRKYGIAGYHGLNVVDIPFDVNDYSVDLDSLRTVAAAVRPKLFVIGGSVILFPHPIKEIRKIADSVGAKIMYDSAHVMGLVCQGVFQDPLVEGADIMSGSTHKSFPCGLGGWLFWNNDEYTADVDYACHPGVVSTHGPINRIVAMAVVLAEMLEFGKQYAAQVVKNAKVLAKAMEKEGFKPLYKNKDYTESHQVAVDVKAQGGGETVAVAFESANIILNKNILPTDSEDDAFKNPGGLRIGCAEVTRMGMKEADMATIASFMRRVAIEKEDSKKVKKDVVDFRKAFQKVQYCFD
jgi:glycine hydroxymethyltransferase